jgi:hypothetical protein
MRLIGRKFVNKLGYPVKVFDVKAGVRGENFVFYHDARPNLSGNKYTMKLMQHTFLKQYRKSLNDFKKAGVAK